MWTVSPRESMVARHAGLPDETSLPMAMLRHPGALVGLWLRGMGEQTWNTLVALGPVVALLLLGGRALGIAWPLAVAAAFTLGPLALNPSPR
jgi:hypothetical protein